MAEQQRKLIQLMMLLLCHNKKKVYESHFMFLIAFDREHGTFVNILDTRDTRRSTVYKNGLWWR